jgi:hypothetical protein
MPTKACSPGSMLLIVPHIELAELGKANHGGLLCFLIKKIHSTRFKIQNRPVGADNFFEEFDQPCGPFTFPLWKNACHLGLGSCPRREKVHLRLTN